MKKIVLLALLIGCFAISYAKKIKIKVVNFQFQPATVNAHVGDTIVWLWQSGIHTTTSTSVPLNAKTWNRAMDSAHKRYQYILKIKGTYQYQCNFHFTVMKGTLNVSKALTAALDDFTVDDANANALLNWKTASSKDIAYFSVQKSTDGDHFSEIAKVQPDLSNQYKYIDNKNASSKYVFYQVQAVDVSGNSELSEIKVFTQKTAQNKLITNLSPNPITSSGHLMLQFNADKDGTMTVQLYNQSGAFIKETQMAAYKGLNNGHFHLGDLTSGTYYIVCTLGSTREKYTTVVK